MLGLGPVLSAELYRGQGENRWDWDNNIIIMMRMFIESAFGRNNYRIEYSANSSIILQSSAHCNNTQSELYIYTHPMHLPIQIISRN